MAKPYRDYSKLAATSSAVSWTITPAEDCVIERIALLFDSAPTTAENITITLDSAGGTAYDVVLRSVDPSIDGATSVVFEDIRGISKNDSLIVAYTNTDGNSITGSCVIDMTLV